MTACISTYITMPSDITLNSWHNTLALAAVQGCSQVMNSAICCTCKPVHHWASHGLRETNSTQKCLAHVGQCLLSLAAVQTSVSQCNVWEQHLVQKLYTKHHFLLIHKHGWSMSSLTFNISLNCSFIIFRLALEHLSLFQPITSHWMMLMSRPPVEMSRESSNRKPTSVTWLLCPL